MYTCPYYAKVARAAGWLVTGSLTRGQIHSFRFTAKALLLLYTIRHHYFRYINKFLIRKSISHHISLQFTYIAH